MINNLAYEQGNCEIYNCSCLNLPITDNSIDCVVTSPPYWGLRDYGINGQFGLEDSLDSYIQNLVEAFREVWRVLKPTGTVWLNLGDTYSNSNLGFKISGVKEKELIGIPWRVALALQADGWYLRQDIIWHKPNPMPEAVKDRCTKSHEYIFLLTKDSKYYYDNEAIMEEAKTGKHTRVRASNFKKQSQIDGRYVGGGRPEIIYYDGMKNKRDVWTVPLKGYKGAHFAVFPETLITPCILAGSSAKGCCSECGAPYKRDFNIITKPERSTTKNRGNMLNVIPGRDKLSRLNSKDMESIKKEFKEWVPTCNCQASIVPSVVLDIFSGSGTTVVTAIKNGRKGIGIELNREYVELSIDRIKQTSMQHGLL